MRVIRVTAVRLKSAVDWSNYDGLSGGGGVGLLLSRKDERNAIKRSVPKRFVDAAFIAEKSRIFSYFQNEGIV